MSHLSVLFQFDKLLIESTQAATITLLLDSPEDDVVNKACSAIFRFAEKCESYGKFCWNKTLFFHLFVAMKLNSTNERIC